MKKIYYIEKCLYIILFLSSLLGLYLFILTPFKQSGPSILVLIISLLILISLTIIKFLFINMNYNNNNIVNKKRNKKFINFFLIY